MFKAPLLQFYRLVLHETPTPGSLSEDSLLLPGRHQFELVGDIGFHGFNPTPYFSRMPDWIPVWFLGVVARNHSVVRAPDLHPNVLFFLRDAGATTASGIPADLLRDKGPLLMLIWVVTGYMSGEWLSLNAGMTGFILMTFFVSTFRIIRMMNGNLEAFVLVGEKVMEIAEDARAELAAQVREEQACREDEGN